MWEIFNKLEKKIRDSDVQCKIFFLFYKHLVKFNINITLDLVEENCRITIHGTICNY